MRDKVRLLSLTLLEFLRGPMFVEAAESSPRRAGCQVKLAAKALHKNHQRVVGGLLHPAYDCRTKTLFNPTNGSWWIVSSSLKLKAGSESSSNYRWWD